MGIDKKQNENVDISFMKFPHYRIPNEIHDIGLKPAETAVYAVLCRYCSPGTVAWPSYQKIADKAGCSKPTVTKAVKRLEQIGLLKKTRRRIGADLMNSNLYEVNHDIQSLYLKLAPDKHDTSPENLNSGKARLLPLVKQLYRGGKGGLLDKEIPIKNLDYKELSTGNFPGENPTLSFQQFKKQNHVKEEAVEVIDYYLNEFRQRMGQEHMNLHSDTWQEVADSVLWVEIEHDKLIDININSIEPMVDNYFSKEYNNGDCNRCIIHFNNPKIKMVNFYEAAY